MRVIPVALLLLAASCSPEAVTPPCSPTAPCPDGAICKAGQCSACLEGSEDALCGAGKICIGGRCSEGECHTDDDCDGAPKLFCKANKCAACEDVVDDARCGPGRLCLAGACVKGDCHEDAGCAAGLVCTKNQCSPQCAIDEDCPDPLRKLCRQSRCLPCRDGLDDASCGPSSACVNGACSAGACHADADCTTSPTSFCKSGRCAACADPADDALCGAGKLCLEGRCTRAECRGDTDCPRGEICLDHQCSAECVLDEDCTSTDRHFCRSGRCLGCRDGVDDALCGPGKACVGGVCAEGACHTHADCIDAPSLFCKANLCEPCTDSVDDGLCGPGRLCLGGACEDADCRTSTDCARGSVCDRNRCVAECTVDGDCKDAGKPFCRSDRCVPCRDLLDDPLCGPGRVCFGGSCTTGTCHLDADCQTDPDRFCHGGKCGVCVDRTDDARCGTGNICALNACRTGSCHATSDCSTSLVCHDYSCQTCMDRVDNRICPQPGQVCLDGVCATGKCHDASECTTAPKGLCDATTHSCVTSPAPTLPYKLLVSVDADGKLPLNNPHAWVRIDFTPLLAGIGQSGKTVDRGSIRVYDEALGGWGEVPSAVLRSYATQNDVFLWFWARGTFTKTTKRVYSVYFTTTDQPGVPSRYDIAPPPDLVMGYRQQAWAWRGDYRGDKIVERQGFPIPSGGDHNAVAIGDYDNDGDLDYVLCTSNDWNVFHVQNLGGDDSFQSFDTPRVIGRSREEGDSNCMGAVAGDFNEDGNLDAIIERNWGDPRRTQLFLGRGDGTFEKKQLLQTADGPRELDVGDFDGDGHLDLTQALTGNPNFYIYWGDGTGRFSPAQIVGTFTSDNDDHYAHAAGNFSATVAAPSRTLDIIIGGASHGYDNSARGQFQNRGGRRSFLDKGHWPYIDVCPGRDNVHGFMKALDFDHDGFDDVLGYVHCDGDGNQRGAFYWHRDPSAPWAFDEGVRLSAPTDWLGHGTAVPSLGHQLLYKVSAAATATTGPACTTASCGRCSNNAGCPSGQVCLWAACGECTTNAGCGSASLVCVEGACKACTRGTQCDGGKACVSGVCTTCSSDTDCDAGWTCNAGVCDAPLGFVQEKPAPSCANIHALAPALPSGTYWLKPPGQTATFQALCDMTTDGGGYTYYGVTGGINTCGFNDNNTCKTLGMDIVMPRTKAHWLSMLSEFDSSYFTIIPGVYKTNGGGNYTGCIMRSPAAYGSGCSDYRVGDGGKWWIRDSTFSEPNGDYTAYCWLGGYNVDANTINAGQGFNDGSCGYCATSYVCSTNDKP